MVEKARSARDTSEGSDEQGSRAEKTRYFVEYELIAVPRLPIVRALKGGSDEKGPREIQGDSSIMNQAGDWKKEFGTVIER